MSSHEAIAGAFGAVAFIIVGLVILWFVLCYLALWGLYMAGKAQENMAKTMRKNHELLAFQTDYLERLAAAHERQAPKEPEPPRIHTDR